MMPFMENVLQEKIEAKEVEVANYQRILSEYRGRWYDQGARHLAELKAELVALKAQASAPTVAGV